MPKQIFLSIDCMQQLKKTAFTEGTAIPLHVFTKELARHSNNLMDAIVFMLDDNDKEESCKE